MKNNKKNKKSNEKAKQNALLLFKSLINNETAVVGARRKGWWWALVMVLFSGLLAAIPSTVKASQADGADFINVANVSGYDVSFRKMVENFKETGIELTVHHEGKQGKDSYVEVAGIDTNASFSTPIYQHYNYDNKLDFEAFYVSGEFTNEKLNALVDNVATYDGTGAVTYTSRCSSFVAFGEKNVASFLYMTGSTTPSRRFGNYNSFKDGYKLTSIIEVKDKDGNLLNKDNANQYNDYVNGVWTNTKSFFTTSYKSTVATSTWQTGLIVLGINYGVTLFMGLMVFILTRGKQNPFRVYTFWETQKIAYWATVAPAVLALGVGFLLSQFSQIAFAMLLGIRVMWMAMKTLKPDNTSEVLFEDTKKDKIINVK
ncbi:MAG: hypothetical protein MJ248_04930 [Bacilli bacterium]|nr:hypothetical protein [Bacilli bacterium]